jgi:hypothetical protein
MENLLRYMRVEIFVKTGIDPHKRMMLALQNPELDTSFIFMVALTHGHPNWKPRLR